MLNRGYTPPHSAYVGIRRHTSANAYIPIYVWFIEAILLRILTHHSAYVSIRQHTYTYIRMLNRGYTPPHPHASPSSRITQHTSAYVHRSSWHLPFTKAEGPSDDDHVSEAERPSGDSQRLTVPAHVSEIVGRLRRIACLPSEVLKDNECMLEYSDDEINREIFRTQA